MPEPMFYADQVGSLLRPARIKTAGLAHDATRLTASGFHSTEALRRIENEEIRKLVEMQEAAGLTRMVDDELRR